MNQRISPLLRVTDLHVTLPTRHGAAHAIRGINFELQPGQTMGLVGESGCGKSMTALALMGLLPGAARSSGRVELDRANLSAYTEQQWCAVRGKRMGMIFQEPMTALNPLHTVGQQIAEPLRLHMGLDAHSARRQALALLEQVALPQAVSRLDAYPHQLSGGQRQRVGIAIALACQPQVLIADEPTTALDVTVQQQILALIAELVRQRGMALILISHDLRLIARHVQQVAVMYAGQFIETGATDAVFANPAHPYTRGLMAARPSLQGLRGQPLATIPGQVQSITTPVLGCVFAPRCAHAQDLCTAAAVPLTPAPLTRPTHAAAHAEHTVRCARAAALQASA